MRARNRSERPHTYRPILLSRVADIYRAAGQGNHRQGCRDAATSRGSCAPPEARRGISWQGRLAGAVSRRDKIRPVPIRRLCRMGFVNSYVPGADLTGIVRRLAPGQDSELVHEIGQATGVSLAVLHSTSQHLVRARHEEDPESVGQEIIWREATITRQEVLARRVRTASKITALDDRQLRRARSLAGAFTNRFRTTHHPAAGETVDCLIHTDLHGGNIILDTSAPADARIASFIDDQLSVGDSGYDIASIQNWAFEVMDEQSFITFIHGLEIGYKSLIPRYALRNSDLLLYLADRSLGRLAYYARAAPQWVEPYGSERLFRHLDLLDRVASAAASTDSFTDPFATVRRLVT
ncbi:phosphotransferase [Streptomyces sp. NPDC005407]|uniref:phosphotransferase n=1 Tax=Streptomyces sp. NPDC005407 TaxID=3155340 RepID=UPI0033A957FD